MERTIGPEHDAIICPDCVNTYDPVTGLVSGAKLCAEGKRDQRRTYRAAAAANPEIAALHDMLRARGVPVPGDL